MTGERLPLRVALDRYADDQEAWENTDAWGVAPYRGRRLLSDNAGAGTHTMIKAYNPRAEAAEAELDVLYETGRSGRRPPAL